MFVENDCSQMSLPCPFSHFSPCHQQQPPFQSRTKCLAPCLPLFTGTGDGRFSLKLLILTHLDFHTQSLVYPSSFVCQWIFQFLSHHKVQVGCWDGGDEQSQEQRKNRATQFCPVSNGNQMETGPRQQQQLSAPEFLNLGTWASCLFSLHVIPRGHLKVLNKKLCNLFSV